MAAFTLDRFDALNDADVACFRRIGFLVVENVLSAERIARLRNSFPKLFAGQFDTGVYPDGWYWREGMSLPDVTRHMANAWKADLTVAMLALSTEIGCTAARLAGWPGTQLGQDTIFWKPPGAKPVAYHQDSSFMSFLDPPQTVTCWVTLDDSYRDAGTLEYAPGSHLWPLTPMPDDFHAPEDYRAQMTAAAAAADLEPPEPADIEVPAGSCVLHAGEIWHGSGRNCTGDRMRRSIGIHLLPEAACFSDRHGGYIYRRYQRTGNARWTKAFFRCCGRNAVIAPNGSTAIAKPAGGRAPPVMAAA